MKGIIFNLMEQFIIEHLGKEKYEAIIAGSRLKTKEPFVGPGTYPDEDLMAIADRTAEVMGISVPEMLRAFGKFCFPELSKKYSLYLIACNHPKPFLKAIESVIHVEVRKLYKDADPPRFLYVDPAADRLIINYRSKRKLCKFMEGLIDGVADYYKSPIKYKQRVCALDGGDVCEFELTFQK